MGGGRLHGVFNLLTKPGLGQDSTARPPARLPALDETPGPSVD